MRSEHLTQYTEEFLKNIQERLPERDAGGAELQASFIRKKG